MEVINGFLGKLTGICDKNGNMICFGDKLELTLEDGEVRTFLAEYVTGMPREFKSLDGFDEDTTKVVINGLSFYWIEEGLHLLPNIDENGKYDNAKMEIVTKYNRYLSLDESIFNNASYSIHTAYNHYGTMFMYLIIGDTLEDKLCKEILSHISDKNSYIYEDFCTWCKDMECPFVVYNSSNFLEAYNTLNINVSKYQGEELSRKYNKLKRYLLNLISKNI